MIEASDDFDLGKDTSRIKDPRDGERQLRTVREILGRFYHPLPERRASLQLVADEVGMGKTFVALGVAYSVLRAMKNGTADPDLKGCMPRVLVIAPQNTALMKKWTREVKEFVERCAKDESRDDAARLFTMASVDRFDDLAMKLRSKDGPSVIVTHMGILAGGKKFTDLDLKRRFLLAVLFRFWSNRLPKDERERLLRGAPESWSRSPDELSMMTDDERGRLPFEDDRGVRDALSDIVGKNAEGAQKLEKLLAACREIGQPHVREREERFRKEVAQPLGEIYREVCFVGVAKALPLVIVDEAHSWKNGPSQGSNGYRDFARYIAPITRRALLLTATPFQLRPGEMLELLKIGSVIAPCGSAAETAGRRDAAATHREQVLEPVLQTAAQYSRAFAAEWSRLSSKLIPLLEGAWQSREVAIARTALREAAHLEGRVEGATVNSLSDGAAAGQPIEIREILKVALRLYAYNEDLSQELGAFVIRHRRRTDHRVFRVGSEFTDAKRAVYRRQDRCVLHAAPGIDVRGEAELPHYLLMRCVSEMKQGKGRSALGSALTGCYSTLLGSAEGKAVKSRLGQGVGKVYLDLLLGMVDESKDPAHPKMVAVTDAVLKNWRAGEKTLLFCFRNNTAKRLEAILKARIASELDGRRKEVLGGASSLTNLRNRFSGRSGDLVSLGLDRVLWSLRWAACSDEVALPSLRTEDFRLTDDDLDELARLALRYGVQLTGDHADRVFIHRAVEHLLARRLQTLSGGPLFADIIRSIADESWVRAPYGERTLAIDSDDETNQVEPTGLDEKGVHHVYEPVIEPDGAEVLGLADRLRSLRSAQRSEPLLFDAYAESPSFWLGVHPQSEADGDLSGPAAQTLMALHRYLLGLSRAEPRPADASLPAAGLTVVAGKWLQRQMVMQALRRALMRESVLLRILPDKSELEERRWGDLLVKRFFDPLPGQRESMAERMAVFVEDLKAASGAVYEVGSSRHAMYEATRMRSKDGDDFVALVEGGTLPDRRERVFAGFNSPLLPEILVCTSVGQEGIDLHRHCRNVIHYDLAWNPAVLEQRTGRVDRIGSKTFRERAAVDDPDGAGAFLEVGVPFLAGTYDERMYEEIRIRAQTFEVLTGGDVSGDNLEGREDEEDAEGATDEMNFPVLPAEMIADLRVRLHVWESPVSVVHRPPPHGSIATTAVD